MNKLFYISCIVIVLVQAGVTFLRWLVEELDNHGHEVIAYALGILLTGGVLAVKLPFIHDPLVEALKPMLTPDFREAIRRNKEEVKSLLGSEIVLRYYYQRGQAAYNLRFDDELKRALQEIKGLWVYMQAATLSQP